MIDNTSIEEQNTPKSLARRRFLRRLVQAGIIAAPFGIGTAAYGHEVEAENIKLERHDIKLPGWPKSADGLKIGHLSDFHCHNEAAVARTKRAVAMLMTQKPDVVFLAGDYISFFDYEWRETSIKALDGLKGIPGGVYAILGNHDYGGHSDGPLIEYMQQAGFTTLRNQSVPMPHVPGVWIVGLEDRWRNLHDVNKALQGVPQSALKILLIHEPDYADEAPRGFAFQFSGHSHGGQIRIPGLPPLHEPRYGRRYPEGLQQGPNHPVYTTRGIGMTGPPMRLCCPPEVTLIRFYAG